MKLLCGPLCVRAADLRLAGTVETNMLVVSLLLFLLTAVKGECPNPDFLQLHVCDTCTNWRQVR